MTHGWFGVGWPPTCGLGIGCTLPWDTCWYEVGTCCGAPDPGCDGTADIGWDGTFCCVGICCIPDTI